MSVESHIHNGVDSPKVLADNLEGSYNGSDAVKLTGDQTIAGVKTFTSIPVLPASNPTADNEAVRKAYVDNRFAATEIYASDTLRDSADTLATTSQSAYTKIKEIKINERGGTIRVKFASASGDTQYSYSRIYVNGVAVGTERQAESTGYATYSEDLNDIETDDLIQIYAKKGISTEARVKEFRLYYDKKFTITVGTVISN